MLLLGPGICQALPVAEFYIGQWLLLRGGDSAVGRLRMAADICPQTLIEYRGALLEAPRKMTGSTRFQLGDKLRLCERETQLRSRHVVASRQAANEAALRPGAEMA
jgi:hypothetical protein